MLVCYLHNTVGPSLSYPVPCPNVMPIFCQFFYQLVLVWCQFDMVEVKGGRLVCVAHHIARGQTEAHIQTSRIGDVERLYTQKCQWSYVFGSLIFLRFSSAFSSPIPTWQPNANRVLWGNEAQYQQP